jgi:hypothetical protein
MPLLQSQTVLILTGGLLWLVNRFVPMRGAAFARERMQIGERASESYEVAILTVETEGKVVRIGSERRRPCCGQFW